MKITSCIRTLLGPVRPTSQTGRLLPDRLLHHRPVRLPVMTGQTGWSDDLLPILVVKSSIVAPLVKVGNFDLGQT